MPAALPNRCETVTKITIGIKVTKITITITKITIKITKITIKIFIVILVEKLCIGGMQQCILVPATPLSKQNLS